jgi:predicted nucleic acid-binding protein
MKFTADSWFFIQLNNRVEKAMKIWREVKEGKSKLVVPTVVLVEITKFLKSNQSRDVNELISALNRSDKIIISELTPEIAILAGKFGNSYNIPVIDSIILATAVITEFNNLLSADNHFLRAEQEGKIKRINF